MNYKEMLNGAAKWGLILGLLMSASRIFEINIMVSGDLSDFAILSIEWLLAVTAYAYIIYRANCEQIAKLPLEVSYGFREVLNYSILISLFASFIVAVSSHIYIMSAVGGYVSYIEQSFESMSRVIAEADLDTESNSTLMGTLQGEFSSIDKESSSPNIISAIISSVANYIMAGLLSAIVTFLFVKRKRAVAKDE